MEKFFELKKHGTDVRTELIAGLTTFMAMAYILAVNPNILSASGMDAGAVFTATALASAVATVLMALFSNLPFALSAGMGLNAYFAYTVVLGMGATWQFALAAVFVEGLIFILLSLTNVREAIFNSIPTSLKTGVSAGIGLFIIIIALINGKLVVDNPSTLVGLISFHQELVNGTFQTVGIQAVLCTIGILFTGYLIHKNVKGSILFGIIATWVLGIFCELTGIYVPNPEMGAFSVVPTGIIAPPADMSSTFMAFTDGFKEISAKGVSSFIVVIISFLFVDIFDTLGTLIGCAKSGKMLDDEGKLPGIKGALLADAIGTTFGAMCGTSTVTTFVESASGIEEGGRTGLTAITTAGLFILALFFWPVFGAIPSFATAPALVMVGYLMFKHVRDIPWDEPTEAIPAFLAVMAMPFFYSISEGIAFGIISYVVLNLAAGKAKKVSPLLMIIAFLFILKYILI